MKKQPLLYPAPRQVRGLVDGGVHLLVLDMVSDTLNAKAAIYAIQERTSRTRADELDHLVTPT